MMDDFNKQQEYSQAEKRVKAIKGFYINLLIYFITNLLLAYVNVIYSSNFYWFWYSVLAWGVAMVLYGMAVFRYPPFNNRNLSQQIEAKQQNEKNTASLQKPLAEQIQHDRAKKRVHALKNYYRHITAYVLVNVFLLLLILIGLKTDQDSFTFIVFATAIGWSIGLAFHTFKMFGTSLFLKKNWEEQKIKQMMAGDAHESKKWE